MLAQPGDLPEGFRTLPICVRFFRIHRPYFRLQWVDDVLSGHIVHITAAQIPGQILIFRFHIQADHRLSGFPEIGQQQLHQVGFSLSGVAQNQGAAVGLVIAAAVKIHKNVGAVLVPAYIEALGIGLTGKAQGIHIGDGTGRQHPLILVAKLVPAKGQYGQKALLLPQGQLVHCDLGAGQLHGDLGLKLLQRFHASGLQFHVHTAMKQNFPVVAHGSKKGLHVLQISLRLHGLGDVVVSRHEPVFPGSVVHDLLFLHRRDPAVVQPQGDPGTVGKLRQNRLFLDRRRILPDDPDAAVGVADNVVIGEEFHGSRQNAVKEILGTDFRIPILHLLFSSKQAHAFFPPRTYCAPSTSGIRSPSMEAPK